MAEPTDDLSDFTEDSAFGELLQRLATTGPSDAEQTAEVTAWFADHPRYEVVEALGVGGFGVVLRVHDRVRAESVALKMLHRVTPAALYRFKQEFRLLQDVRHPGLVRLLELTHERGRWFFTMDYVPGRPLDPASPSFLAHVGRLAEALHHLHASGRLHLDLKPANVRVRDDGSVVILDFGLARLARRSGPVSAGTPGYMAPEQQGGGEVGPASDVYALGVMLSRAEALLDEGQRRLVARMLRAVPGERPTAEEVAGAFLPEGKSAVGERDPLREPKVRGEVSEPCGGGFSSGPAPVGRRDERSEARNLKANQAGRPRPLRKLVTEDKGSAVVIDEKFADVSRSAPELQRPEPVLVHGPDRRANAAWFDATAARWERAGAVVLRSACRVHEMLPYRVLDELADGLAAVLRSEGSDARGGLSSGDAEALAALFPTLSAAVGVAPGAASLDLRGRARAVFALRELLAALARAQRVVWMVEDVQWADEASLLPLLSLVDPPVRHDLTVVMGCWSPSGDLAASLGAAEPLLTWVRDLRFVEVGRSGERDDGVDGPAPELPGDGWEALALVAASFEPPAAGLLRRRFDAALLDDLLALGALRWAGADRVELGSSRWDSLVDQRLSPRERAHAHGTLAELLGPADDVVSWARHLHRSGRTDEAEAGLVAGAGEAEPGRACQLYATLHEIGRLDDPRRRKAWARALAATGRWGEAGQLVLDGAADPGASVDGDLDAAEWLLAGGHIDEGLELSVAALAGHGVSLPRTLAARVATAASTRWRLRRAPPVLQQVGEVAADADGGELLAAFWALGLRVAATDLLQGAPLLLRQLDLAASRGDVSAYARGLAVEAVLRSVLGADGATESMARATELAAGGPARGGVLLATAMARVLEGAFREALDACEEAEPHLRMSGGAGGQDAVFLQGLRQVACYWTGQLDELRRTYLRAADLHRLRGDRFARVHLTTQFGWLSALMDDDVARAQALLGEAAAVWTPREVVTQQLMLAVAGVNALLYAGRLDEASQRLADDGRALRPSGLLLVPVHKLRWNGLCARVALARAEAGEPVSRVLRGRLRPAAWRGAPWAEGLRLLMRGRLQVVTSQEEAVDTLREAADVLGAGGMEALRQGARWRWACLRGDAGEARAAVDFFARQGCARPEVWARFIG